MKWAVRVDASGAIGAGHLSRCLALAGALRADGAQLLFVCRAHPGHGGARIEAAGHALHLLPAPASPAAPADDAHAHWLGAPWQEDADATAAAIAAAFGGAADGLVVDHYAIDARWERRLRAATRRLLVVDDLADRDHDCDVLLDQNLVERMESRYEGRVAPATRRLLGPGFALLAPDFAPLHRAVVPRRGPARRACLFFGGGAAGALARTVAERLAARAPGMDIDVVLPYGGDATAAAPAHVHLHADLPSLAPLLARADVAAGAAGVAALERLCLGLPSVLVAMADNQRAGAQALAARGLAVDLGPAGQVDADGIAAALLALAEQPLEAMSRAALALVDGLGAARVAAIVAAGPQTPLHARPAEPRDEALLLAWANDPEARAQAFQPARIAAEDHARWFRARVDSADCRIHVVETAAGLPLGQVRFDRGDGAWTISYSIDPALRGRGLGARVLAVGLDAHAAQAPGAAVVGLVRHGNAASRRVFEGLGFAVADLGHALEYRRASSGSGTDEDR